MTAHKRGFPAPAWITLALDSRELYGPEVDIALGGVEPMVDDWEAGNSVPTEHQVELLAELTGYPVEYFYQPVDRLQTGGPIFICERNRRGDNALTVLQTSVGWDGTLKVDQLTPDRPAYRPRKTVSSAPAVSSAPTRGGQPGKHVPEEDPSAPGCCTCGLAMDSRNARHQRYR